MGGWWLRDDFIETSHALPVPTSSFCVLWGNIDAASQCEIMYRSVCLQGFPKALTYADEAILGLLEQNPQMRLTTLLEMSRVIDFIHGLKSFFIHSGHRPSFNHPSRHRLSKSRPTGLFFNSIPPPPSISTRSKQQNPQATPSLQTSGKTRTPREKKGRKKANPPPPIIPLHPLILLL